MVRKDDVTICDEMVILEEMWQLSDALFESQVTAARALDVPIALRHPFIFYLGHLPSFAANTLLLPAGVGAGAQLRTRTDARFDTMFARGIDPDVDDSEQCHDHPPVPPRWPDWHTVARYRDSVRTEVRHVARTAALLPCHIALVAEHEAMHVETLRYMLVQLARRRGPRCHSANGLAREAVDATGVRQGSVHGTDSDTDTDDTDNVDGEGNGGGARNGADGDAEVHLPDIEWCDVPAGTAAAGLTSSPADTTGAHRFVWDNELDGEKHVVAPFRIAARAVSVGEMVAFVRAGGYHRRALWDAADWAWVRKNAVRHPASWECDDSDASGKHAEFRVLTAGSASWRAVRAVPASVSLAEARAFARWRGGFRLPSELQWVRAAHGLGSDNNLNDNNGDNAKNMHTVCGGGEHERERKRGGEAPTGSVVMRQVLDSEPCDVRSGARSWCGAIELGGNGWELTSTPFHRFPAFRPTPEYPQYSADFFDGKHFVLRGASWATHPALRRPSFRNFYHARYPYVFSKFRLVDDAAPSRREAPR